MGLKNSEDKAAEFDLEKGLSETEDKSKKESSPSCAATQAKPLFNPVEMEKTPVKEKRKKGSNKKAPKPPRPPQAPSLDAADHKLIRELTELAMLKRARIERLKALRKMKTSKSSSSSSSSSILATVFTIFFCIVIIFHGMSSSGSNSRESFQGSPLVSAQYSLNPSVNNPNAPSLESHNFVNQITSSYWSGQRRRRRRTV